MIKIDVQTHHGYGFQGRHIVKTWTINNTFVFMRELVQDICERHATIKIRVQRGVITVWLEKTLSDIAF